MHAHRNILAVLLIATAIGAFGSPAKPRDVRLEVTDSGKYILAGRPVPLSDLRARLRDLKSSGEQINLHITGGGNVEYKYLMPAVKIAQEEGLAKVAFLTVPPTAPDASASPASK
jgi:biopolymer transport protein ExbD